MTAPATLPRRLVEHAQAAAAGGVEARRALARALVAAVAERLRSDLVDAGAFVTVAEEALCAPLPDVARRAAGAAEALRREVAARKVGGREGGLLLALAEALGVVEDPVRGVGRVVAALRGAGVGVQGVMRGADYLLHRKRA